MGKKRITDYPEATEIANDDYVWIDNGTDFGSRKFLAKNLGGGGSAVEYERLCFAQYVGNDAEEIPTMGTLTEDTNYSEYLSYSSSTGKFTVLADFDAFVVPYVYQYRTPSGSYANGAFYINDTVVKEYQVAFRQSGVTAGYPVVRHMTANDTFYSYTPASDGYPQQMLKVYKINGASSDYISALQSMIEMTAPTTE